MNMVSYADALFGILSLNNIWDDDNKNWHYAYDWCYRRWQRRYWHKRKSPKTIHQAEAAQLWKYLKRKKLVD